MFKMSSNEMWMETEMDDENRATPEEKKKFKELLKTFFTDMEMVKHRKFQTKIKLLCELVMEHTDLISTPRGYLVILSDFHNYLNFLQELTELALNVYNMKYNCEDGSSKKGSKHEISEDKHLLCRNNMYFIYQELKELLSRVEATQKQQVVSFCQKELKKIIKVLKKKCLGPSPHFPKGISIDDLANWAGDIEPSPAQLIEKEYESKSIALVESHEAEMSMKNDTILKMENQLKEISNNVERKKKEKEKKKEEKEYPKPAEPESNPLVMEHKDLISTPRPRGYSKEEEEEEEEEIESNPVVESKSKSVDLLEATTFGKPAVKPKSKPEKSKPFELVETKKPAGKREKSKPVDLMESKPLEEEEDEKVDLVKSKPVVESISKPEKSKPAEPVETKPGVKPKSKPVELVKTKPVVKPKSKPEKSKPVELVETKSVVKPEKSKPVDLMESKPLEEEEEDEKVELVESKPEVESISKPEESKPAVKPKSKPEKSKPLNADLMETKPVVELKVYLKATKPGVKPRPKSEKSKPLDLMEMETKPVADLKPKPEKSPAKPNPDPVNKGKKRYVRKTGLTKVKAEPEIKIEDDDSVYLMFDEPPEAENPLFKRFKR